MTGTFAGIQGRPVRVGVCGMGFIGPAHVEALRRVAGVEVVAISTRQTERGQALARRYGIPKVYGSHEALLDDPSIDAVHICTGNREHVPLARRAIASGKHVVCEKPLAISAEQAGDVARLADDGRGVYAVNYQYRYYPMVQQARALVRTGRLGRLLLIHGRYVQDWLLRPTDYNWRVDSKESGPSRAFADIGSHWCDLVEYVTGERITRLSAITRTVIPERTVRRSAAFEQVHEAAGEAHKVAVTTEDLALVHFETDRGTVGSLVISQVSAGHKNDLFFELNGEMASLAWSQESPEHLWLGRRDAPNESMTKEVAQLEPGISELVHFPPGHPEGYPDALKNLFELAYERVRDPARPVRYPTFADGLRSLRLVEAVISSARAGGTWVTVALDG